jgi:hypothetical protein
MTLAAARMVAMTPATLTWRIRSNADGPQILCHLRGLLGARRVADRDMCAPLGEGTCRGGADAAGATRHQGDLSVQVLAHVVPVLRGGELEGSPIF